MHHDRDLVLDHCILNAVEECLGSLLFDIKDFFDHLRHLLLVDLVLVHCNMLLDVNEDGVADGVHLEKELGDVCVVHNGLDQELSSFICDDIVSQVDRSDLLVLLKKRHERLN